VPFFERCPDREVPLYDKKKRRKKGKVQHIYIQRERKKPMTTREEKKSICIRKSRKERKRMMNI
jgi:phosphoribosylaminoimidazole carboxylase (NCAIR synthetase)